MLPFLAAEIDVVYCLTTARSGGDGAAPEQALRQDLAADVRRHGLDEAMRRFRERIGLADLPALNLEELARPFQGRSFTSAADYHQAARRWIDQDLTEAARGNVEGPLKAALDVLRDVRSVLRAAVEFSGLTPRSHRDDFLGRFVPVSSFLTTGPPMVRLAQTRALLDAGVLTLAGPQTRFSTENERFLLDSPQVKSPARAVDIVFDARVPATDLAGDTSGLRRRLHARGVLTTYTNAYAGSEFATSGVAVTPSLSSGRAERPGPHLVPDRYPHRVHPVVYPGRQRPPPGVERVHRRRRRDRGRPARRRAGTGSQCRGPAAGDAPGRPPGLSSPAR